MNNQPHPNQHFRLSVDAARRDYADGLITAAGLLYYCVGVLRKQGQHIGMPVKDWLDLTGLQERTFYKAKAKLIAVGRLEERITGFVELWMSSAIAGTIGDGPTVPDCPTLPERSRDSTRPTVQDCPTVQDRPTVQDCPSVQADCLTVQVSNCPTVPTDCPIVPGDCPNGQVTGPIVPSDCPIVPNERPKPIQRKRFEQPSDNSNNSNKPTTHKKKVAGERMFREPEKEAPQEKSPNIPRDLYAKLQELQILTGNRAKDAPVLRAIASRDISQAYGAAAHVERTFESCSDPKSVFLFQLPKQPKEKLGPVQPVKTAEDFRLPLPILKKTYPGTWQEAAIYHGYSQEEIADAEI